jgi:RNA polymerase sigma-70 factor (ECF subfamily)
MTEGTALADAYAQRNEAKAETAVDFDELVRTHQPRVTRLAYRLLGWRGDVDDIVQDVFLAAFTHASRFRNEASVATWLTAITLNKCRSHHRRRHLWKKLFGRRDDEGAHEPARAPPVGHAIGAAETSARVRLAVQALSQKDREVVVLRYFENLTPAEIAGVTGQSTNAIEVRLHRARAKLAETLREWSPEEL